MNKAKILSMFPLVINLTQEMIDLGLKNLYNVKECIGAQMLKSEFPNNKIEWNGNYGALENGVELVECYSHDQNGFSIDMEDVREPMVIILKLKEGKRFYG